MNDFAIRLKQLLDENETSMYRLAKEFGCSKQTISNWCAGINEPKVNEVIRLALFFDVTADYLVGLENEDGSKTVIAESGKVLDSEHLELQIKPPKNELSEGEQLWLKVYRRLPPKTLKMVCEMMSPVLPHHAESLSKIASSK